MMLPPHHLKKRGAAAVSLLAAAAVLLSSTCDAFSSKQQQHHHVVNIRPSYYASIRQQELYYPHHINRSNDNDFSSRRKNLLARGDGSGSESSGSSSSTTSFKQDIYNVVTLIGAQALLIPIAIFIAKFLNLPNSGLGAEFQMKGAILDGVKFTLPLFGIAGLLRLVEPYSNALQNVTKATQRSVLSVLGSTRRPFFALFVSCILGAIAGIGEEWLFRGVFQELLSQKFQSPSLSLALSGLVFGLLHAVTPVYAILAGAASVFFGYLYIISHNLAVPMITHAVYDVFALMWAHISVTALEKEEIDEILNFSGAPVLTANTFKEGHLDVSEEETDGDKGGTKIFNA
jgi:membrane protease YdiL (CAAX protease family)